MGLMSSNPYYTGNPIAEAINGAISGWNTSEDRFQAKKKQEADLAQQALVQQIAQEKAAREKAEYDLQAQGRSAWAGMTAQKNYQDASGQLTDFGKQRLTGLMGNTPQTIEQPVDELQQQLLPPDQVRMATGWHAPLANPYVTDVPNPQYAQTEDIFRKAMLEKGGEYPTLNAQQLGAQAQYGDEGLKRAELQAKLQIDPNASFYQKLMESGKYIPESVEAFKAGTGKLVFAKDPSVVTWSEPYEKTVGGKKALVQKSSTGQIKPVIEDKSTTFVVGGRGGANITNSNEAIEAAAQAILVGQKAPSTLTQRGGFKAEVEKRVLELNPQFNFIKADANAKLSQNVNLQQKAAVAEMLPELITQTADLGKGLDYSDFSPKGKLQQTWDALNNDPKYIEYVTKRNDLILTIGGVMRANGMTDMAQKLEEDSAPRSMSPKAFDAWAKGQMDSLEPRIKAYKSQIGGKGNPSVSTVDTSKPVHKGSVKGYRQPDGSVVDATGRRLN